MLNYHSKVQLDILHWFSTEQAENFHRRNSKQNNKREAELWTIPFESSRWSRWQTIGKEGFWPLSRQRKVIISRIKFEKEVFVLKFDMNDYKLVACFFVLSDIFHQGQSNRLLGLTLRVALISSLKVVKVFLRQCNYVVRWFFCDPFQRTMY